MNARGHGYQFGRPHGNGWGQAPNDTRVRGAGPRARLSSARKHARPRIRCSRLLGAQEPAPTLDQNNAPEVVALPGRGVSAHRRGAPGPRAFGGSHEAGAPHTRSPKRVMT
jgi:hypothetical protein